MQDCMQLMCRELIRPEDVVQRPISHADAGRNIDTMPFDGRVRESFERQGLMRHLGAELMAVEQGMVKIRMPYSTAVTQQHGFFHAGATSSIADSAGGYAGYTLFPENSSVLTIEFKINLVAPAQGEYLEATGKVVRSGRTLTICQLEVHAIAGSERTLVALGQQTLMCMHGKPDVEKN